MTTATNQTGPQAAPATARLNFFRLLRAEWIKLSSLRSSVILLLCAVAVMAAIAALGAWGISFVLTRNPPAGMVPDPRPATLALPTSGLVFAQLLVGSLAVIQVGSEYGTGMIRASLTASPRRISNVLAKALVMAIAAFVVGAGGALASYLIAQPFLNGFGLSFGLDTEGVLPGIVNAGVSLALMAVMAVGIGYVLRSSAAGITVTLGVLLVLPILAGIGGMFNETIVRVGRFLPSNAASQMVAITTNPGDLTQFQGALVLLAWAAAPCWPDWSPSKYGTSSGPGPRTPARMGARIWSRRVLMLAMGRAASGRTW
jgi:ABC-2 type transport system permease protein